MSDILLDEMYEGKAKELRQRGYEAVSVKELRDLGFSLKFDYSVIKYAEENGMVLVTEDKESHGGCLENNIPSVLLGQNSSVDEIIESVKKFEILP